MLRKRLLLLPLLITLVAMVTTMAMVFCDPIVESHDMADDLCTDWKVARAIVWERDYMQGYTVENVQTIVMCSIKETKLNRKPWEEKE
jgi:hypothetical protein